MAKHSPESFTEHFPELLSEQIEAERVELDLAVSERVHYFDGHFPGAPVLAGVAQLHWVVHYTQRYFPQLLEVTAVEVLKFQVMVRPGSRLRLVLEQTKPGVTLFSYTLEDEKVASGRLKWEVAGAE
ncbi:hypothetical protein [Nitrincola sp. MINF-07-Sa-05]|uniref:ApeI family dehydratase n=1 Tax=Nitrincola salilacus TaxID=3400273 RepID=UPI003918277E